MNENEYQFKSSFNLYFMVIYTLERHSPTATTMGNNNNTGPPVTGEINQPTNNNKVVSSRVNNHKILRRYFGISGIRVPDIGIFLQCYSSFPRFQPWETINLSILSCFPPLLLLLVLLFILYLECLEIYATCGFRSIFLFPIISLFSIFLFESETINFKFRIFSHFTHSPIAREIVGMEYNDVAARVATKRIPHSRIYVPFTVKF